MSEHGFVPISPRRLHPLIDVDLGAAAAATSLEAPTVLEAALDPVAVASAPDDESTTRDAIENGAALTPIQPDVALLEGAFGTAHVDAALDAARIRTAAIALAAAACARALRYAVDRNPRLLARFVDDALRAAGSPQQAIVHLAPSAAMSGCVLGAHDYVADASLSPCDVFVECADGTLGATIEQRAEGLVRAVST